MQAEFERHPGFLLLRLKEDMRLWGRAEEEKSLVEKFRGLLDEDVKQVVLSLAGLTALDTMGIATLVRVLVECSKRDVGLKVVLPSGLPGESLRRVRILEGWPTFPDESAAVCAARA